jgi:hypothetical protein
LEEAAAEALVETELVEAIGAGKSMEEQVVVVLQQHGQLLIQEKLV